MDQIGDTARTPMIHTKRPDPRVENSINPWADILKFSETHSGLAIVTGPDVLASNAPVIFSYAAGHLTMYELDINEITCV